MQLFCLLFTLCPETLLIHILVLTVFFVGMYRIFRVSNMSSDNSHLMVLKCLIVREPDTTALLVKVYLGSIESDFFLLFYAVKEVH